MQGAGEGEEEGTAPGASPPFAAGMSPGPFVFGDGPRPVPGPADSGTPAAACRPARRRTAWTLRRLAPLSLLAGVATAATGCAGADRRADPAAVAASLRASLASTRASLAALQPTGGAPAAGASPVAARGAAPEAASPPQPDAPLRARLAALAVLGGAAARRGAEAAPLPSEAAELLGLPAEAVVRRLGEPALRRPEGPVEIWLYTARSCALDVILYRDEPAPPALVHAAGGAGGAAATLRVAFAAARASGSEPRTEAACLRDIAAGRHGPEASGRVVSPRDAGPFEAFGGPGRRQPRGPLVALLGGGD
jgi:hypothetical protein